MAKRPNPDVVTESSLHGSAGVDAPPVLESRLDPWFSARGWRPFPFQRDVWRAYLKGENGLIHAPTGYGKTHAAFGGLVIEALENDLESGLKAIWITPLKALANDTEEAIRELTEGLGLQWRVEIRHGDISSTTKSKQRRDLPEVLITTPESLTSLLTYTDCWEPIARTRLVVCDEWHELLTTKRGVQTELALSRLRSLAPNSRFWALSATIGDLDDALDGLLGDHSARGSIIHARVPKRIEIETLLPDSIEAFPWSGHLGLKMAPLVLERIRDAKSTLVFTNTRNQCELWYKRLCELGPDLEPALAQHHGSLSKTERADVETRMRAGALRAIVCTSSLDLGVDFSPVEQVVQVGSPKGIARLIQRAGRSGHQPGATSRILGAPTSALEILEFAAARRAVESGRVEPRHRLSTPLDVLVQHWTTAALTRSLSEADLRVEVQRCASFRSLSDDDWEWVGGFVQGKLGALRAYPEYTKVVRAENGTLSVSTDQIARRHRMAIGTITSDSEVEVRFVSGGKLGHVEERFISKLKPGSVFQFAGRRLELARVRGMVAYVRLARRAPNVSPAWSGGRAPLSSELATAVSDTLNDCLTEDLTRQSPEVAALQSLLDIQAARSRLPGERRLLVEWIHFKKSWNLFLYPFAGRLAHEGIAALTAHRLTRSQSLTLRTTVNDYGVSLQSAQRFEVSEAIIRAALSPDNLTADLIECVNTSELARRRFREIARVSGLVFQGYPGSEKSAKNLQLSSTLLYDVFEKYDPENRLADQARREALSAELENDRLRQTLDRLATRPIDVISLDAMTPFAFALWAESTHHQVSSQPWDQRMAAIAQGLSKKPRNR